MNIFLETEALSGEDLTTAILRVLLLRSQEIREAIVRTLSDASRLGRPISLASHFSCLLQHATEDQASSRWGRLDLLIETDDAVVGIENKLFAAFQENQPEKYLDAVRSYAESLAVLRQQKSLGHFVAVLAPDSRQREVQDRIRGNDHLTFVSWERVLKALTEAGSRLDPITETIRDSFIGFMEDKLAFMRGFQHWSLHLGRRFDHYGTPLQQQIVRKLWEFFPDPGRRLSNGKTWVGYYFCVSSKRHSAWFGFVPDPEIESGAEQAAELIIATSFPLSLPAAHFRALTLRNKAFFGQRPVWAWAVRYDAAWSTPEKWQEALDPVNKQTQDLIGPELAEQIDAADAR